MAVTIHNVRSEPQEHVAESSIDFERLFHDNWQRVYLVLYRVVGDPDEAQDLALEAFWRLYSHPPRHSQNVSGWLYRVAIRLGYNALRSVKRRHRYEQEAANQDIHNHLIDPAAEFDLTEQRQRVRQIIDGMQSRSAKVLLLRHSGFSYVEISSILKVPVSSVGTLLARAEKEFEQRFLKENR